MAVDTTTQRETFRTVLPTKQYSGDRIKKNEGGGACGTYGRMKWAGHVVDCV